MRRGWPPCSSRCRATGRVSSGWPTSSSAAAWPSPACSPGRTSSARWPRSATSARRCWCRRSRCATVRASSSTTSRRPMWRAPSACRSWRWSRSRARSCGRWAAGDTVSAVHARAGTKSGGVRSSMSSLPRPMIAIVGRPNVGKSTLFNRLVGQRRALVRDVPGVTRDRLYGHVEFERWQATVIDTGGFDPSSEEPLIEGVRRQVLAAVDEADLVLFVVDARAGLTALDSEIADVLRRSARPVVLAANKIDSGGQEGALGDLYGLGFGEPVPVSAEHGRGVAELLEVLRARTPDVSAAPAPAGAVQLAVIGRPNVGKSSLVN